VSTLSNVVHARCQGQDNPEAVDRFIDQHGDLIDYGVNGTF
jgi:hypothetical protein